MTKINDITKNLEQRTTHVVRRPTEGSRGKRRLVGTPVLPDWSSTLDSISSTVNRLTFIAGGVR
eukprot:scaffold181_cov236-Alexandrium_tamarense.AAC.2